MRKQDKNLEREHFNRFDREGGYERLTEKSYEKILREVFRLTAPKAGELVVDVGCGSGAFTSRLKAAFPDCRFLGLDIAEGCIARAQEEHQGLEFRVADAEATGLASGSADLICFFNNLHHFPDFSRAAEEAFRILKPGGRFFSFDPHHHNPAFWLYRAKASPLYSPIGVTANERLLTPREVREVFSRAGFEVGTRVFSGIAFCSIESSRAQALLKVYNALDAVLGATPLAGLIGAWVVGYGKKPG